MARLVPFDGLPPDLQKALVDKTVMDGEGPGDLYTTDWQAEDFLRSLDDEHLNIHLALLDKPGWYRRRQ